jgi:hypothetical protein
MLLLLLNDLNDSGGEVLHNCSMAIKVVQPLGRQIHPFKNSTILLRKIYQKHLSYDLKKKKKSKISYETNTAVMFHCLPNHTAAGVAPKHFSSTTGVNPSAASSFVITPLPDLLGRTFHLRFGTHMLH